MRALDRFIQARRIAQAIPYVPAGATVLDIGSADGALFHALGTRIAAGVGIDPDGMTGPAGPRGVLYQGMFPAALPDQRKYDVICMLAVLEHLPDSVLKPLAQDCLAALKPGGKVVATLPSPKVDHILAVLRFMRLIDGMSLEQHHGVVPDSIVAPFVGAGFQLVRRGTFQLGLNNIFVFQAPGSRGK